MKTDWSNLESEIQSETVTVTCLGGQTECTVTVPYKRYPTYMSHGSIEQNVENGIAIQGVQGDVVIRARDAAGNEGAKHVIR